MLGNMFFFQRMGDWGEGGVKQILQRTCNSFIELKKKIRSKLFETSLGDPHLWEVKRESEIKIKLECEKKKSIQMDLSFGLGVNNSKFGGLI